MRPKGFGSGRACRNIHRFGAGPNQFVKERLPRLPLLGHGVARAFRFVTGRKSPFRSRRTLRLESTLADEGEVVTIHGISNTGLPLESAAVLIEGQKFDVELPEVGRKRATVVWASARYYGCRFLSPVPKAAISAALLRNPARRIEPMAESPAWELLEERLEDHARDVDPGALSPATRALVIVDCALHSGL